MRKQVLNIAVLSMVILFPLRAQKNETLFAQQNYQQIIEKCTPPSSENDHYWLAQALRQQGKVLQAINTLEQLTDSTSSQKTQALKADIYFSQGRYNEAENFYKNTASEDASFYKLMQIYEKKGNYIQCINHITNRLDSASTNTTLLSILANSYYRSNAKVMAQKTYQKIYELDTNNTTIAYKLVILHINTHKFENITNALEITNNILKKDSSNMRFTRVRARLYYLIEKYESAREDYKKLYKRGYNDETTCIHLGLCEYNLNFYHEAINYFTEALLQNANNAQTNLYLGRCYQQKGNCEKSFYYLEQAERLMQPQDEQLATLCWERQNCHLKLHHYEQADSCLQALLIYSSAPINYFYLAHNYDKNLKNKDKAIEYYTLFLEKNAKQEGETQNSEYVETARFHIEKLKEDKFWGDD